MTSVMFIVLIGTTCTGERLVVSRGMQDLLLCLQCTVGVSL